MEGPKAVHKHLFRVNPPQEFVEEILRACGFEQGLADLRWMSKGGFQQGVQSHEQWLPFLEPYYLPCKAERFFGARAGPLTVHRLITVLRHILRPLHYDLVAQEMTDHGSKQTFYQIRPVSSQQHVAGPPGMEVVFT